jgi:hypothetical protein
MTFDLLAAETQLSRRYEWEDDVEKGCHRIYTKYLTSICGVLNVLYQLLLLTKKPLTQLSFTHGKQLDFTFSIL